MGFKKLMGHESFDQSIKLKGKLTYEELFALIKDAEFSFGAPYLDGKGVMQCIRFPGGQMNQVSIVISMGKVCVQAVPTGVKGLATGMAADAVTGGWATFIDRSGNKSDGVQEATELIRSILASKGLLK